MLLLSQGILATYGPGRGARALSWHTVESSSPSLTHRWQAFQHNRQGWWARGDFQLIQKYGGPGNHNISGLEGNSNSVYYNPFFIQNEGTEPWKRLCNLSKVAQQGRSRVRIRLVLIYRRSTSLFTWRTVFIAWPFPYNHEAPEEIFYQWPDKFARRRPWKGHSSSCPPPALLQDKTRTLWNGTSSLFSSKLSTTVEVTVSLGCCQRETEPDTKLKTGGQVLFSKITVEEGTQYNLSSKSITLSKQLPFHNSILKLLFCSRHGHVLDIQQWTRHSGSQLSWISQFRRRNRHRAYHFNNIYIITVGAVLRNKNTVVLWWSITA